MVFSARAHNDECEGETRYDSTIKSRSCSLSSPRGRCFARARAKRRHETRPKLICSLGLSVSSFLRARRARRHGETDETQLMIPSSRLSSAVLLAPFARAKRRHETRPKLICSLGLSVSSFLRARESHGEKTQLNVHRCLPLSCARYDQMGVILGHSFPRSGSILWSILASFLMNSIPVSHDSLSFWAGR